MTTIKKDYTPEETADLKAWSDGGLKESFMDFRNTDRERALGKDDVMRITPNDLFAPHNWEKNFGPQAQARMDESLSFLKNIGTNGLRGGQVQERMRSHTDVFINGKKIDPDDELPMGEGFAYGSHLFRRMNGSQKIKDKNKEILTKGANIFTEHMEALKTTMQQLGVYSEMNPGGMPIDIKEAKRIWFGDSEPDIVQESEWKQTIEMGDRKLDPKKVRKFNNADGSITWEVLNDDKTVQHRFTMGDYAGTKLFAQGGYKVFARLLKKAQQKLGSDVAGQFDSIRTMFGG